MNVNGKKAITSLFQAHEPPLDSLKNIYKKILEEDGDVMVNTRLWHTL